jgi:tetratricopeptide (TPR) repeat protein
MMRKLMIIVMTLLLALITPTIETQAGADNGVPYLTYAEDAYRNMIPTQDAYVPVEVIRSFSGLTLKNPEDMVIKDGVTYIADTGNRRIIISDSLGAMAFGEDMLLRPTGLHIDDEGRIHVADIEQSSVFVFDRMGTLERTITRPMEPMFGQDTPFRPYKVHGDSGGNLYILSEGTYQGLIQLGPTDEFLGFFGANPAPFDLRAAVLKRIFSDDIVENFIQVVPQTMINLAVDTDNRVYTVTRGTTGNSLKRLNVSGINRLPGNLNDSDVSSALAVGPIKNIYTISEDGFIREYDQEGNLLFMFGGKDNRTFQQGMFNVPSAIEVGPSFDIHVLDKGKNEIQVFRPTAFADIVHEAVDLYQEGKYLESMDPWTMVLAFNAMFDLANKGIGRAHYKAGNYDEAAHYYSIANDREGYSDAFWEIRNVWLSQNLSLILILSLILYVIVQVQSRAFPGLVSRVVITPARSGISKTPVVRDLAFIFHMIRHPLDGFYEIRYRNRIKWPAALILYVVLFLEYLFMLYYEGQSFNGRQTERIMIGNEAIAFLGPLALFVIATYLVCAVTDGEGRLKEVFAATIYALAPMILFWPIVVVLSRGLTLNEVFIYDALMGFLLIWSAILVFFSIKDIQHYGVAQTVKAILVSAFTMVMMIVTIILISGLAEQVANVFYELFSEVISRG